MFIICSYERFDPAAVGLDEDAAAPVDEAEAGGVLRCWDESFAYARLDEDEAVVGWDEDAGGVLRCWDESFAYARLDEDEAVVGWDEDAAGPLDEAEAEDKNFLPQLVAI